MSLSVWQKRGAFALTMLALGAAAASPISWFIDHKAVAEEMPKQIRSLTEIVDNLDGRHKSDDANELGEINAILFYCDSGKETDAAVCAEAARRYDELHE